MSRTVFCPEEVIVVSNGKEDIGRIVALGNDGKFDLSVLPGGAVNQNAFSNVQVNGTTIQAGDPEDTINLKAGTNIGLTADATNQEVTVSVIGQVASAALADTATLAATATIAESANKLAIARTINGVAFDGTENIIIKAEADGGEADTLNGKSAEEIISECSKAAVPTGCIVIWSGSTSEVPSNWNLCDGTNGTPNLQDKFVLCAGSSYAVGATGGEATHILTTSEMPSHSHVQITGSRDNGDGSYSGTYVAGNSNPMAQANSPYSTASTGGSSAHNNMPPYYALAYIMKIA